MLGPIHAKAQVTPNERYSRRKKSEGDGDTEQVTGGGEQVGDSGGEKLGFSKGKSAETTFFFFFFFGCTSRLGGFEPRLSTQSPDHWTARVFPGETTSRGYQSGAIARQRDQVGCRIQEGEIEASSYP